MLISCDLYSEPDIIETSEHSRAYKMAWNQLQNARTELTRHEQMVEIHELRTAFLEIALHVKKNMYGLGYRDRNLLYDELKRMGEKFDNDRAWHRRVTRNSQNPDTYLRGDTIREAFEIQKQQNYYAPRWLEDAQAKRDMASDKFDLFKDEQRDTKITKGRKLDLNQSSVKLDGLLGLGTIDLRYTRQTAEVKHYLLNCEQAYVHVLDAPLVDTHEITVVTQNIEQKQYANGPLRRSNAFRVSFDGIAALEPDQDTDLIKSKNLSTNKRYNQDNIYIFMNRGLLNEKPLIKQTLIASMLMGLYTDNEDIIADSRKDYILRKYYKAYHDISRTDYENVYNATYNVGRITSADRKLKKVSDLDTRTLPAPVPPVEAFIPAPDGDIKDTLRPRQRERHRFEIT